MKTLKEINKILKSIELAENKSDPNGWGIEIKKARKLLESLNNDIPDISKKDLKIISKGYNQYYVFINKEFVLKKHAQAFINNIPDGKVSKEDLVKAFEFLIEDVRTNNRSRKKDKIVLYEGFKDLLPELFNLIEKDKIFKAWLNTQE
jgi:hypothetical protein